jgi:hypothetical protein
MKVYLVYTKETDTSNTKLEKIFGTEELAQRFAEEVFEKVVFVHIECWNVVN